MTDINTPEIVDVPLCSNGVPISIVATNSPGTLIYSVPNDPDYWYEVTLIVSNISGTTDFVLEIEWGGNAASNRTAEFVTKLTTRTCEARLCRGVSIYGYCVTASGGVGTASVLNVQVKSLRYKQNRTP